MADEKIKMVDVRQELVVNTYADLWHGAKILKGKAARNKEGSTFVFMASLCMFAFAAEAYTNFVGPRLFPVEWLREKKPYEGYSILRKYRLICDNLGILIIESSTSWKLLEELVQFRNTMAHGKQEKVVKQELVPLRAEMTDYLSDRLRPNTHQYCNAAYIGQVQLEVGGFLETIHEALRKLDSDEYLGKFGSFGMGQGSASLVEYQ
ncbi:hypothetical protein SAMN05216517_106225 [Janthinobacterium sp. OK676]|uniref:hypothetical protein n=1 Tax=Janthinobacterium sp. OK676 TaxID=1855295 RepID=UPI00088EA2FB|nr:hypothetical protein [Janthinobacterium sp. OK676]SDM82436.1 hypothetical protein SAMN05216517_106225 [Janthinobacterium sp. OK676]